MALDYTKLNSNKSHAVWHGPSGGTTLGITDVYKPLAAEINNTGGTSGVINVTPSISWNDWGFGTQASETLNEPSMADAAAFTEFGANNYGGNISYFLPAEYDINADLHSVTYDLTDAIDAKIDVVTRLDGDIDTQQPAANGEFVSVYRVEGGSDQNPFTPGESKRHTRNWFQKSDFSHYVVVGPQTITAIAPATFTAGSKGRIRASQGGRDATGRMAFTTSNASVIDIDAYGGMYSIPAGATGSATVTITDEGSGEFATVAVVIP